MFPVPIRTAHFIMLKPCRPRASFLRTYAKALSDVDLRQQIIIVDMGCAVVRDV